MCRTCFESFIRTGGTKTFVLTFSNRLALEAKQEDSSQNEAVRDWLDEVWSQSFGATSQAILKTKPFEFSAAELSDLDQEALREEALAEIQTAMEREGFTLDSNAGQQRGLAVLFGFLNQALQKAMGIEFYVWTTQRDARVRSDHAVRDDRIFRWDNPPEGGHPSQDFGCRCYARALGIEGYWVRISEGVDTYTSDIEQMEGNVEHMYLDSEGNVTVGKGKKLSDADGAAALPFLHDGTSTPASKNEIRAEHDLIAGMQADKGRPATYFGQFTSLFLSQSEIDKLVTDHMRGDFRALLRLYPDFGNLPLSAQIALWDMIYNLGPTGLANFKLLRQAIDQADWDEAARQSHRLRINDDRNDFVFDLFMDAAEEP